jgi:3-oxoacyl-(acyl-carrier-protein) synthase
MRSTISPHDVKSEQAMKLRGLMVAAVMVCGAASLAVAQSGLDTPSNEQYVPRLGEIMNLVQVQHAKLWFAGQAQNWELAAYELRQLRSSLADAAVFYSGIPVSKVTTVATSIQSISDAVDAKDGKRFAKAVGELTDGCNACHSALQRSFVAIRIPNDKPFGNQVFQPQSRK